MRLELLRMLTKALKDQNIGVNHFIPIVPRDADDEAPPLLPEVAERGIAVFNDTEDDFVAGHKDPPVSPAIYVLGEGPLEVQGEPTPDGQIRDTQSPAIITIRYVTDEPNLAKAIRDGEYTLRAVMRSLRELMKNQYAATLRTRGSICLIGAFEGPSIYFPVMDSVGKCTVTGAIGLNLTVRDAAPSF